MSLDKMILASVKCVVCGAGYGECNCWSKCKTCGWSYRTGEQCRGCGGGTREVVAMAPRSRKRRET